MNDEQLSRLLGSLQTTDLPDPVFAEALFSRLETEVDRRRVGRDGRPVWVLVAAALLLAALLGVALAVGSGLLKLPVVSVVSPSPSPSPSASVAPSASTSASATASISPRTLTASGWRVVDPASLGAITEFYPAAWSGERFVIAGHPQTTPPQRTNDVQFMSSFDGQTWSISPWSKGYPLAYAFDGAAGVAVGSDGNQAAVWTSPDSETWKRLRNPPALTLSGREIGLQLTDVAHGPAGYVALGDLGVSEPADASGGGPMVVWSPDGRDWERVPMEPFQHGIEPYPIGFLDDVAVVQGRYVVTGRARGSEFATLWTSTDGRAWTETPVIEGMAEFIFLEAGDAGALMFGIQKGGGPCVVWRSADGLTWNRAAAGCPVGTSLLVAAPFGFVAVTPLPGTFAGDGGTPAAGSTVPYPCAGGLQLTTTGDEWTCVVPPVSDVDVNAAASAAEVLVLGFGTASPQTDVWIADVRVAPPEAASRTATGEVTAHE